MLAFMDFVECDLFKNSIIIIVIFLSFFGLLLSIKVKMAIVQLLNLVAYSVFFEEGCEQNYWGFLIYYLTCYQLNSNRTEMKLGIYIFRSIKLQTEFSHVTWLLSRIVANSTHLVIWWLSELMLRDGNQFWWFGELSIEH